MNPSPNKNEDKTVEEQKIEPQTIIKKEDSLFREEDKIDQQIERILQSRTVVRGIPSTGKDVKFSTDFVYGGSVKTYWTVVTPTTNTTDEQDLASYSFDKNALHAYLTIRITATGFWSVDNITDSLAFNVGVGTAPLSTTFNTINTPAGVVTDSKPYFIQWIGIVKQIGTTIGELESFMTGSFNTGSGATTGGTVSQDFNSTTTTLVTTSPWTLGMTCKWSAADPSHYVRQRMFIVEILH